MFRILIILIGVTLGSVAVNAETLLGFDDAGSEKQRLIEAAFDKGIDARQQDVWLKSFSARPHHAGSKRTIEIAQELAALFTSWGYDTKLKNMKSFCQHPGSVIWN